MKICSRCGYQNTDNSGYCEKCGQQFISGSQQTISGQTMPGYSQKNIAWGHQVQIPQKKSKKGVVIVVIAAVFLLAAATFVFAKFFLGEGKETVGSVTETELQQLEEIKTEQSMKSTQREDETEQDIPSVQGEETEQDIPSVQGEETEQAISGAQGEGTEQNIQSAQGEEIQSNIPSAQEGTDQSVQGAAENDRHEPTIEELCQIISDYYNTLYNTQDYTVSSSSDEYLDNGDGTYYMLLRYTGGNSANVLATGVNVDVKTGDVTDEWGNNWNIYQ